MVQIKDPASKLVNGTNLMTNPTSGLTYQGKHNFKLLQTFPHCILCTAEGVISDTETEL